MNHIKWAAWGVVNIETLDRQQRRNYLKKVRSELDIYKMELHSGGNTEMPFYRACTADCKNEVAAGKEAFKKICEWFLGEIGEIGDTDVSGENGSVRSSGAETV